MTILLKNAVKRFAGKPAVDGVSAEIDDGAFFVVLGASGCGKSTLLRLIAGLEVLDEGTIALHGETVADATRHIAPEKRNVGMVFQSYALWPHMSVAGNVAFPIETNGDGAKATQAKVAQHLRTVALSGFDDRLPASLSGGQRQRVALARCLAQGAKTVLMDEPLANLDPHLRATMEDELARFHAASGATTIYITHDQREAMALADRMALMDNGRFLQVDTPEAIYQRPTSETVARFIGRSAILDAHVENVVGTRATVDVLGEKMEAACAPATRLGSARLMVRPENVVMSGSGALTGRIDRISYRGGTYEGTLSLQGDASVAIPFSASAPPAGDAPRFDISDGWVLPR